MHWDSGHPDGFAAMRAAIWDFTPRFERKTNTKKETKTNHAEAWQTKEEESKLNYYRLR